MTQLVPSIASSLPGLKVVTINGFRDQEDWGRWTLGKTTSVRLQSAEGGWRELRIDFSLPYAHQHLEILLNGQSLELLESPSKNAAFSLRLPTKFLPGSNELRLITDKSNMDHTLVPFASADRSDISIQLHLLELSPLQIADNRSSGLLYRASQAAYPVTYRNVSGSEIELFIQRTGPQLLNYRLLRGRNGQDFDFQLDGQSIYHIGGGERGTLALGQLPVNANGQLQRLTVTARGGTTGPRPNDSIQTLEKVNGPFTFYVQELTLAPQTSWTHWAFPLASAGILLCVALLALWLFRPSPSSTSGK